MTLTSRFHWLAFTTRMPVQDLFDLIGSAVYGLTLESCAEMFHELGSGGNGYKSCMVGLHGVRVYYTKMREDVHVVIPGSACDYSSWDSLLAFFSAANITFKRVDVALDGVERDGAILSPVWLYDQVQNNPRLFRTRVQISAPADPETGLRPESYRLVRGPNGSTFYLGASASERLLRVYDSRGFTRMEMQFRQERAAGLADIFSGMDVRRWGATVVGLIRGHVDFVDGPQVVSSQRPLAPWWAAVVTSAEKISPAVPVVRPQLDRTWRFFLGQWSSFVATCLKASGGNFDVLFRLVEEGSHRMSSKHDRMIREAGGVGAWVPAFN